MTRIDVMLDIETMGIEVDSTIFQIAAIAFDIYSKEIFGKFNAQANISLNKEQIKYTNSTMKWWNETNPELFEQLTTTGNLSSKDIMNKFYQWFMTNIIKNKENEKNVYLWGNGILFDNRMIKYQCENVLHVPYPIFYRNDRDVRTIVDLAGARLNKTENELKELFNDPTLIKHNAYDDVQYQINLVSGCYKLLLYQNNRRGINVTNL